MKKAFKEALPHTIPVFAGYIFLGIAFGFLMVSKQYPTWYPIVMSIIIYSGALEFAAIPLLSSSFEPVSTFIMGLLLSARHLFYGLSMLKKYNNTGKLKLPLIFTLTDETFSIASTIEVKGDVNKDFFYLSISLLNYFYWILGTTVGAVFGNIISFDTNGIDFALTALFIVLFLEQIKTKAGKISGIIGLISTVIALAFFGKEKMVIAAMALIMLSLLFGKKVITNE